MTNQQARDLALRGKFDESLEILHKLQPKSTGEYRNQLVNIQSVHAYKKLLGMPNEFQESTERCLQADMGRLLQSVLSNIGLVNGRTEEGISLLKTMANITSNKYLKTSNYTNLGLLLKDLDHTEQALVYASNLYEVYTALSVYAWVTDNKQLFDRAINWLYKKGYKAEMSFLKEIIKV